MGGFWAGFCELLGWKSSIQSGNTAHRLDESVTPDLSYFSSRESQVRVWHAVEPESDFFPLRREGSSDNAEWRRASGFQGRVVLLPRADVQRATGEDRGEAAPAGRALRRRLARSAAARIRSCFTRADDFTSSGHPRPDQLFAVRRSDSPRAHLSTWLRDWVHAEEEWQSEDTKLWWQNTHGADHAEPQVARLGDDWRLRADHGSHDAWWGFCLSYCALSGLKG